MTIRLSDGTAFEAAWCAPADNILAMQINGPVEIGPLVQALDDPYKTRCITVEREGADDLTYCGYSEIRYIINRPGGTDGVLVGLGQEV